MDIKQTRKYELLGLNVAYYRRRNKLTQEQLAELVGIDRTHMGNIELARSGASLDVIFRIADALEIPVYKLFEFRD
ncbi:helix-turn-helix transcriptional regulator [Oscillospiraceae bacterium 50-16]|nr:helix-turn-helix transcriptional regulator [Lawsonibacter sp.]